MWWCRNGSSVLPFPLFVYFICPNSFPSSEYDMACEVSHLHLCARTVKGI